MNKFELREQKRLAKEKVFLDQIANFFGYSQNWKEAVKSLGNFIRDPSNRSHFEKFKRNAVFLDQAVPHYPFNYFRLCAKGVGRSGSSDYLKHPQDGFIAIRNVIYTNPKVKDGLGIDEMVIWFTRDPEYVRVKLYKGKKEINSF